MHNRLLTINQSKKIVNPALPKPSKVNTSLKQAAIDVAAAVGARLRGEDSRGRGAQTEALKKSTMNTFATRSSRAVRKSTADQRRPRTRKVDVIEISDDDDDDKVYAGGDIESAEKTVSRPSQSSAETSAMGKLSRKGFESECTRASNASLTILSNRRRFPTDTSRVSFPYRASLLDCCCQPVWRCYILRPNWQESLHLCGGRRGQAQSSRPLAQGPADACNRQE